jgi:hypothetical protein
LTVLGTGALADSSQTDTVGADVTVTAGVVLVVNEDSFTLTGAGEPGDTLGPDDVTGSVTTNSPDGYTLRVLADGDLVGVLPATGSILINDLIVTPAGGAATPMSSTSPGVVVESSTEAVLTPDTFTHSYSLVVPTSPAPLPGTYHATLTYTATVNPAP